MSILETPRLALRCWNEADEEPLYAICSDPLVMRYVGDGSPWSRETTREFIATAMKNEREHGYCRWALVAKEGGQFIGFCGLTPSEQGAEVGWRLAATHWGRGLATEAARAVLKYGFEQLGLQHITATVQAANEASRRVVEKLGMLQEREFERNGRRILLFAATRAPRDV